MNSMDADAFAFLIDGVLCVGNQQILRRFRWNDGHLVSLSIEDRQRNAVWTFDGLEPDLQLPGEALRATGGSLRVTRVEATPFAAAHLRAEVGFRLGELRVLRCFRVYPDAPAIACDTYLAGRAAAQVWQSHGAAPGELAAIESLQAAQQGKRLAPVTERLAGATLHLRHTAVQLFDVTDRNNNLVHARTILPYRQPTELTGSILLTEDRANDLGLFILKEAPLSDVQLCWPGADFVCQHGEIRVLGIGMHPADVLHDEWTSGYGTVVGIGRADQDDLCMALRRYQLQARRYDASESTLVLNTWGDRNRDARLNESFTLSELDAAARLGVTHLQLDDGWQAGRSGNSAFAGGTFDGIWDREDFWAVHPEKFPNGLQPIVDHANRHRLQLGLWYNPSKDNDYANWLQDAEQIVRLHRTHGVALFKIDGVDIATKRAERNLGRMLEHACTATQGAIRFNLDVTAGRRFGYFVLNEYGNKFLENRYTDFRNYYPHWTLRNLWQLARYVPLQGIQAEFLNVWRNPHLYPTADPLAPSNVGFAYAFACTMAAQPLAWMEASQLPEAADAVMPLIRQYRAIQSEWHQGRIMPIGEEPDGFSWTGFQSCTSAGRGYVLVFREHSDRASTGLRLWECPTEPMRFTHILGSGQDFIAAADEYGRIGFELPQRMSFALYRCERTTDRAEIHQ